MAASLRAFPLHPQEPRPAPRVTWASPPQRGPAKANVLGMRLPKKAEGLEGREILETWLFLTPPASLAILSINYHQPPCLVIISSFAAVSLLSLNLQCVFVAGVSFLFNTADISRPYTISSQFSERFGLLQRPSKPNLQNPNECRQICLGLI